MPALQRTPCGAAELGCAERRQRGRHAACERQPARRWQRRRCATAHQVRRCAQDHQIKARPASSRPVLGSRCGVNCLRQFNITGCCRPVPQSRAKRAWCGTAPLRSAPFGCAATPVMSCAPPRLPRGQLGTARRARIPKFVRSWLRRHRRHRSMARCARGHGVGPARPPIRPRGAPQLPPLAPQRSAVLAGSRVRASPRCAPLTRLRAALREVDQRRSR